MWSEGHMCPLRMCPSIHGEECVPPHGRRAKLVDSHSSTVTTTNLLSTLSDFDFFVLFGSHLTNI